MKECLNYQVTEKGAVECQSCAQGCRIQNRKVGLCGVRENIDGKLFLLTYGKAAAAHIDPIEKKPFFHFLPGTQTYSLGTLGCNFRCGNCQNFDISQIFGRKGNWPKYEDLNWGYELSPEAIVREAQENNCQSIAYTYNEPTIFWEYALDTMKLAKKKGLKNIWVSNGYMAEKTFEAIAPFLDAINIDIKSMDDSFYRQNCGARVFPVLENCQRFRQQGIWLEVTTLIIPGQSDDPMMLKKIAEFVAEKLGKFVPWHVSAFSGIISWKMENIPNTSHQSIATAYRIGKEAGLEYVYAGNVGKSDMENTYCPQCGKLLIKRVAYGLAEKNIDENCPKCQHKIAGVFN